MLHQRKPLKQQADKEHHYSEEAAALLPAPISSIQVQKKNKSRFSIFIGDEFLIGVSDAVLTKFNLYKGTQITFKLLQQISEAEDEWAVREYLIRLLSRRDHSRKELQTKAFKKGISIENIDKVLDELEQKGYINDESFARKYASDKYEFNDWGPYKIKSELQKKGITASESDKIIRKLFGNKEIILSMEKLIIKKKNRFLRVPVEKRQSRIFEFLMRKGYASSDILQHKDELLKLISS